MKGQEKKLREEKREKEMKENLIQKIPQAYSFFSFSLSVFS